MTRFVTGGAGFIGANYLFYLRGHYPDDRLVCIDKLTYAGNLSTLAPLLGQPNFRFAKVDICDREAVYGLFEEEHPDVVVNFAAESHVDRSIADPSLFLQTNIIGTSVLMDACRKYGNVRFHQVSTDEVYGDLPLDRPDLLFTEQTPLHTSSPYSSSKAAADLLAGAYGRTYGLPVTISRCSNNYGPYQFPEKLIPLMIVNALADRPLPVYGRGLNVRDWLYVGDHCRAIDLIIHQARLRDGSRKITYITEVQKMEGTTITTQDIFRFEQTGFDSNGKILGHFVPTGLQPSFLEKFEISGIKLPDGFFTAAGTNDIAFEGGQF